MILDDLSLRSVYQFLGLMSLLDQSLPDFEAIPSDFITHEEDGAVSYLSQVTATFSQDMDMGNNHKIPANNKKVWAVHKVGKVHLSLALS